MTKKRPLAISLLLASALAGCIVSDQLTTFTIRPDGSAEWVRFQSNIRSSEPGAKGDEELKRFIADFDARRDPDVQRVLQAGGEIVEARWLPAEGRRASVIVAGFPGAVALEEFCTVRGEKGEVVARPRFTQDGKRRRFSIAFPVPKDVKRGETSERTLEGFRAEQASGISETRIIVAGGRIVGSQGFTIAADKGSALVEPARIEELLRTGCETIELFLEWELD
jgi:hypothetical protein